VKFEVCNLYLTVRPKSCKQSSGSKPMPLELTTLLTSSAEMKTFEGKVGLGGPISAAFDNSQWAAQSVGFCALCSILKPSETYFYVNKPPILHLADHIYERPVVIGQRSCQLKILDINTEVWCFNCFFDVSFEIFYWCEANKLKWN